MDVGGFEMELIMLVGVPTSGKSTFSNQQKYSKYVRISSDDILQEVAKERQQSYNTVFKANIRFAQIAMMKVLRKAIEDGKSIIWDQTNLTRKQRREKLKHIPAHYKKTAAWPAPVHHCIADPSKDWPRDQWQNNQNPSWQ